LNLTPILRAISTQVLISAALTLILSQASNQQQVRSLVCRTFRNESPLPRILGKSSYRSHPVADLGHFSFLSSVTRLKLSNVTESVASSMIGTSLIKSSRNLKSLVAATIRLAEQCFRRFTCTWLELDYMGFCREALRSLETRRDIVADDDGQALRTREEILFVYTKGVKCQYSCPDSNKRYLETQICTTDGRQTRVLKNE
jgi:hypothetical protein